MLSSVVAVAMDLVRSFGLPALFVLFVLKGAIVGKPLPTSAILPGYIFAVAASRSTIILAIGVAAVGYVAGQLVVYYVARQYGLEALQSNRWLSISDAQADKADQLFRRYSGVGVFVTNLIPYVGSFIFIPAGLAHYPVGRLTVYALVSTLLNYVLIVVVVIESVDLLFGA